MLSYKLATGIQKIRLRRGRLSVTFHTQWACLSVDYIRSTTLSRESTTKPTISSFQEHYWILGTNETWFFFILLHCFSQKSRFPGRTHIDFTASVEQFTPLLSYLVYFSKLSGWLCLHSNIFSSLFHRAHFLLSVTLDATSLIYISLKLQSCSLHS